MVNPPAFKSLRNLLKNNFGIVLLGIVLLLIITFNWRWGYLVIGNDNFSPELNPLMSLQRILESPAFREYRVMGIASDSEQADLFRVSLYSLLDLFLPSWVISQGYIYLALITGVWSTALLAKALAKDYLFKEPAQAKLLQWTFFFAGLVYLFNLKTLHIFYFTLVLFIAAYAFFPLLCYAIYKYLHKPNFVNLLVVIIALMMLSTAAFTITTFIVMLPVLIVITLLFIWIIRQKKRISLKTLQFRGGILAGLLLLISAFWLVPFFYYAAANSIAVTESFINRQITPNTIENETDSNTFFVSLIYRFNWLAIKYDDKNAFVHKDFYDNPSIQVFTYTPILLAFIGTYYLIKRKQYRLLIFPLLVIAGTLLTTGSNPPLGFLFAFFQENVPFFRQVFRWPSSKLWLMTLLPLSVTAGFGGAYMFELIVGELKKGQSKFEHYAEFLAFSLLSFVPILVFGLPYFSDNFIFSRLETKLPVAYIELEDYLSERDPRSRIYLAPEANTLYFRNHDWSEGGDFSAITGPGFWGSGFLHYLLPNPLIERNLTVGSDASDLAQINITSAYNSGDQDTFATSLRQFSVKYVLRDSSNSSNSPGYNYDLKLLENQTAKNLNFRQVWGKDNLTLYEVIYPSDGVAITTYKDHNPELLNQVLADNEENVKTVANDVGVIFPLALDYEEKQREKNDLVMRTRYKGDPQELTLDTGVNETYNTKVDIINGQIIFTPYIFSFKHNGEELLASESVAVNLPSGSRYLVINDHFIETQIPGTYYFSSEFSESIKTARVVAGQARVFDLRSQLAGKFVLDELNQEIGDPLTVPPATQELELPLERRRYALTADIETTSAAVMAVTFDLQSEIEMQIVACIEDLLTKKCVNDKTTHLVRGREELRLVSGTIQPAGNYRISLGWASTRGDGGSSMELHKFSLALSENITSLVVSSSTIPRTKAKSIGLKPGDDLELRLPIFADNAIDLLGDEFLYEYNISSCPERNEKNYAIIGVGESLALNNRSCLISFFPILNLNPGEDNLYLSYFDAANRSGLPIDFSLRKLREVGEEEQYFFQERSAYLARAQRVNAFFLPQAAESYRLEVNVYAGQTNASINELYDFALIPIQPGWKSVRLSPNNNNIVSQDIKHDKYQLGFYAVKVEQGNTTVTIPTAEAPGWVMFKPSRLSFAEKTMVNGWQQGFNVDKTGSYLVFFWPNLLSQGLIVLTVLFGWYFLLYKLDERFFRG